MLHETFLWCTLFWCKQYYMISFDTYWVLNLHLLHGEIYRLTIDVIRNSVCNWKTQLIEGYKQKWPISFYWKAHTISKYGRHIDILLIESDLQSGLSFFLPLAKLGFSINNQLRIKSIPNGYEFTQLLMHKMLNIRLSQPHLIWENTWFVAWINIRLSTLVSHQ